MSKSLLQRKDLASSVLIGLGLLVCVAVFRAPSPLWGAPSDPASTPPLQVRFIQFKGNHAFSSSELKKILTTKEKWFRWFTSAPLDPGELEEDVDRIERFYRSQGFFHAKVVSHQVIRLVGHEVRIEIRIEEGPPMLVSSTSLTVNGQSEGPWHKELLSALPLHTGERFTTPAYQDIEKAILQHVADWGYPKAKIEPRATLDKKTNQASVSVDVAMGAVCFFGSITIEGNETVSDEIIRRELTFQAGERFSASKVQESQQKLFNLDLFQFVDLSVDNMEGEQTTLPIRILIKEAKKQTVRMGVGYGTEDSFRGQVQYEIRNFLGDGRRLQIDTKASSLVQFLEGKFVQPYIFDPRSTLTVEGGISHEDQESFENRKIFISPVINYRWNDRLTSYAGYDLEANRLLDVRVDTADLGPADQENQEYFVASLLGGNTWEHVDDTINPHKGFRFLQSIEWASVGLGSEVDFIKLILEGRSYFPLQKYGVLAGRLKWGGIQTLENTEDIPIFKRFFAGGSDSVRGYPYQRLGPLDEDGNPIGGMSLVEGSVEWRFPLRKLFDGVLFFDFGNVFEQSYELLWTDLRYSAGCGVRYLTPVGPLRLDFGYELNPPEQDFFNPYQIHFSIGQAF